MLKQNLSQKLLQKLSPQQIQLMKLLQIPTATLEQRIKEELEANPALEEGNELDELEANRSEDDLYDDSFAAGSSSSDDEQKSEGSVDDYEQDFKEEPATSQDDINVEDYMGDVMDDDIASYKLNANLNSPDDEEKTIPIAVESSLQEHLEQQLGMTDLNEHEMQVAGQVIGSIDDDGYLRRDPISLVDDLAFSQNVMTNLDEINRIIKIVQRFDPPGVGAVDLQQCLLMQLERKLEEEAEFYQFGTEEYDNIIIAIDIMKKHFNEFSKKHYDKLKKNLNLTDDDLRGAIEEVLKLNPKPASGYATNTRMIHYIVPDFTVKNTDGELDLSLNARNAPELRVSDGFKEMLKSYGRSKKSRKEQRPSRQQKEAVMFIKQKIDSAKWFIEAIRQRQQTMYKTMYSIMQYQYDYFLTGDERVLRPMILKDIAEITGLDISTVSRVANSKYVETEFGTKRLKDFFSESLQTQSGEEVSTLEVKKILTDLIKKENKRKPLSDEKLKNALRDKGYNIARRTVAKYREQLNIPVARLRKEL